MYYQPTPINWQNYHFLITSSPDDQSMKKVIRVSYTIPQFSLTTWSILINESIQDLKKNKVKLLIRTCEKTYDETLLKEAGIEVKVRTIRNILKQYFRSCNSLMANFHPRNLSRSGLPQLMSFSTLPPTIHPLVPSLTYQERMQSSEQPLKRPEAQTISTRWRNTGSQFTAWQDSAAHLSSQQSLSLTTAVLLQMRLS